MTVAVGDGVGAIRDGAALSAVARDVGSVRLVLGWLPAPIVGIDPDCFADVVALMPGWGVRDVLSSPKAHFVPTRLAAIPALLAGALRPDVLITRLVERNGRLHFGTEVSWQSELVESGVPVLAIVDDTSPTASAEAALDPDRVTVVGYSSDGPIQLLLKDPEPVHEQLADAVLQFVPDGARLQYGPGQLGTALLSRAKVPLQLDTGLLTDAVLDLDERGLLAGNTVSQLSARQRRPLRLGRREAHPARHLPHARLDAALSRRAVRRRQHRHRDRPVRPGQRRGRRRQGRRRHRRPFRLLLGGRMSRGGLSIIAVPSTV